MYRGAGKKGKKKQQAECISVHIQKQNLGALKKLCLANGLEDISLDMVVVEV
jgi:hypothetical protein